MIIKCSWRRYSKDVGVPSSGSTNLTDRADSLYATLIRHTLLLPGKRMNQLAIDSRQECNAEVNSYSGVPLECSHGNINFLRSDIPTVSFIQPYDHLSRTYLLPAKQQLSLHKHGSLLIFSSSSFLFPSVRKTCWKPCSSYRPEHPWLWVAYF